MKLYTSYFAQIRNFPKNLVALSTVIFEPKWYKIGGIDKNGIISVRCTPLQPGKSCEGLCDGKCFPKHPKDCTFLQEYRKQLDAIDFKHFMYQLFNLHERLAYDSEIKDFNFAFIFYEKYDNPCSERWPVQEWLRAHNVEVKEWQLDKNR